MLLNVDAIAPMYVDRFCEQASSVLGVPDKKGFREPRWATSRIHVIALLKSTLSQSYAEDTAFPSAAGNRLNSEVLLNVIRSTRMPLRRM